jgi:hypothetical protein
MSIVPLLLAPFVGQVPLQRLELILRVLAALRQLAQQRRVVQVLLHRHGQTPVHHT